MVLTCYLSFLFLSSLRNVLSTLLYCNDSRSKTLVDQGVNGDLGGRGLDGVNRDVGCDKGCTET